MSRKSRYILIVIGLLVFLVLAPLTVMYALGLSYDWETGKFVSTGILAVRVEPNEATISLNGKAVRDSSADIKFLRAGEYEVVITKPGYFPWSKRLAVYENQVTWANGVGPRVILFQTPGSTRTIVQGIRDFYVDDRRIVAVSDTEVRTFSRSTPPAESTAAIPAGLSVPKASPSGDFLLLTSEPGAEKPVLLILDVRSHKLTDLSSHVSPGFDAAFSENDELFLLNAGVLYKMVWKVEQKVPILRGVQAFTLERDNLYYIRREGASNILATANTASLEEQVIRENVPAISPTRVLATAQKTIFIASGGKLYRVNSSLEAIADNIEECSVDDGAQTITCLHAGELSFFNPVNYRFTLVTRSGEKLSSPTLRQKWSHVFYVRDNRVVAAELDTRDKQNQYTLYEGRAVSKIWVDAEARTLWILDGGQLIQKQIRE